MTGLQPFVNGPVEIFWPFGEGEGFMKTIVPSRKATNPSRILHKFAAGRLVERDA
jgi:hypothetical protein